MELIDKMTVEKITKDMEKQDKERKDLDSETGRDSCFMDENQLILYEDFLSIIRDLTDTARKITRIEEEKAIAVSQKRHELLEGYMKKEQAGILKLRGLDQHRIRVAKLLGWDSLSFSQILEKVSLLQREHLNRLFDELERELMHLLESKGLAERIINVRIYEMMIVVERKAGIPYDNTRNVNLDEFPHANLCDRYV